MKQLQEIFLRFRFLAWPVVSGIASIVVIVMVIIPQIMAYLDVQNEISGINGKSVILEAKSKELASIDEAKIQQSLQVAFTVLPSDRDVPQAMSILQDVLVRSGLTLRRTAYGGGRGANNSFQLNLTVQGSMDALRNFMINLREEGRLFQVESINAQFQKQRSIIEAEIPIAVYYEAAPQKIGSIDQALPKLDNKEEQLLTELSQFTSSLLAQGVSSEASASAVPIGKSNPFE